VAGWRSSRIDPSEIARRKPAIGVRRVDFVTEISLDHSRTAHA
jgi:hypothetical protein